MSNDFRNFKELSKLKFPACRFRQATFPNNTQMSAVRRATWNGVVIAESDKYEVVEGNTYFPPDSVKQEYLQESANTYVCGWKGLCNYYNVVVNGQKLEDAAWVYKNPKAAAKNIGGYYAFWRGVKVE